MATSIVIDQTGQAHTARQSRPIVWSIAASDSGGGAGIQADLNTIHSLGCHGCTVITAITAQNSLSVDKFHPISAVDLAAQWQALEKDLLPKAIKIGLIPEPKTLRWLARHIQELRLENNLFCIWDPVLKASTGARFLDAFDRGEIDPLLKQVDLVTPNLQEAEMLTKMKINSFADIQLAAKQLLDRGVHNVLIKGGHAFDEAKISSNTFCRDYFANKNQSFWLSHARQNQPNNHGTGCSLASAIASFVAQEYSLSDSIVLANRFIQQSLRLAAPQGKGAGPVWQAPLENHPTDLGDLIKSSEHFEHSNLTQHFLKADHLGLYAIVDNLIDLERLITQGIDTLQWRDKHTTYNTISYNADKKENLKLAIKRCQLSNTPLYINDDWQLALEFNAYGVHLGQEDLALIQQDDLKRIQKKGLRLGISCHNETELAYAHSLKPSYLAFGPVFSPHSKIVSHSALGLNKLKIWQDCYGKLYPTTCIGGISPDNMAQVLTTGMTSVAVISALANEDKSLPFIRTFKSLTCDQN
ncbi:MAG: hydroxymethylpyrimidine kinase/phosphomethylpyrimidine kinase/thiamine-phosphate diphosphorylase [Oleispira sp.]